MPLQRSLSWSSALRDMRNDRAPAETRNAAIAARNAAKLARTVATMQADAALREAAAAPLFAAGRFDRAAILRRAWARARCARVRGDAASWQTLMSRELRRAWDAARAARIQSAH